MRTTILLILAGLAGCAGWVDPTGALVAADAASIAVFGRGIVDAGVSAVSGRDCSVVRLDRGQSYCAQAELVAAVPFCTRSLGVVDCWADPSLLPATYRGVADQPAPTSEQARYRSSRWPRSLNAGW